MPHLNTSLYLVMPLPLNMFDDYRVSSMVTALDAFQHIIENTVSNQHNFFVFTFYSC